MKKYLTLAEVREILTNLMKERELTLEQRYALKHAEDFSKLDIKKSLELKEELMKLPFMTERVAVKIVDILPQTPEEVRAILYKEPMTITLEEIQKILETVKKYI